MIKISNPKSHKSPICGEATFAPSALSVINLSFQEVADV